MILGSVLPRRKREVEGKGEHLTASRDTLEPSVSLSFFFKFFVALIFHCIYLHLS